MNEVKEYLKFEQKFLKAEKKYRFRYNQLLDSYGVPRRDNFKIIDLDIISCYNYAYKKGYCYLHLIFHTHAYIWDIFSRFYFYVACIHAYIWDIVLK